MTTRRASVRLAARRSAADIAILGANVLTLDPRMGRAEAIAVAGGRIVAVGDAATVRERCDGRTELVDGRGLTVVPGLTDAHIHPIFAADLARGADLTGVRSRQELRAALGRERERLGRDAVVRGWGLNYAVFGSGALDGDDLEPLAGGPALVSFFDCHTHLATRSALLLAGVTGPVEFADNSEIVCRDGVPTGELRELSARRHVDDGLPQRSEFERRAAIRETFRALNSVGLTGGHAMDGTPDTLELLRELEASGELTVRLSVPLTVEPGTSDEELDAWLLLRDQRGALWAGGVAKFFADGVVESGTAWLEEPDARGTGTGCFWPDPKRLRAAVVRLAGAGFQCATHAIGDRAVRFMLDAYRDAGAAPGVRHRIEHAETLSDELLRRFAIERVVASMQPLHGQWRSPAGDDSWTVQLGSDRAARAWRSGDLRRSGALVALGSDWPVAHYDPRVGMAYAIQRRMPGAPPDHALDPEQGLDPLAALEGYTTAAAAAVGRADEEGRVAPGFHADLTAFAADPLRVTPDDLADLPVELTVVGGRIVHRS